MFLLALEGVFVFGGWKCCGRVELFALCLKGLVGVCRIALRGQNHPPGTGTPSNAEKVTKTPSRYKITLRRCLRERVAGVSTRSGGCIRLWGVEMLREGGTVRVVPEGACGGVQNRPPRTKPPSGALGGDKIALPVPEHPPATFKGVLW